MIIHIPDPKELEGDQLEEDPLLEEIEWDEEYDPGPNLVEDFNEGQALDAYERELDRSY